MYNERLIPYYNLFSHISLCPRAINLNYTAAPATSCFIFYKQSLSNTMWYMLTDFAILSYLINHSAPVNIPSWQMVCSEKVQHTDFFSSEVLKYILHLKENYLSSSKILTIWSLIYYLIRKLMSQASWVSRHLPALELLGKKLCFFHFLE